jgi:hypothetical protein
MAGAAQSLRSRLTALSQEAYRHLRADKEPHEKAAKAVDDKWRPLVDKAKGGADAIRKMLSDWETGMLRQAEAAANALAEDGNIAEAAVLLATAPMAPTKIKGGAGRAASAKTVTVVDTVTDWPALILSMQNNTDLRELVLALANKALKAGATVPGVSTKQVREVR